MTFRRFNSLAEQVAEEIRAGLLRDRWTGQVPGRNALAAELGVNHKTCGSALKLLESEGLLVSQGRGRGRAIVQSASVKPTKLRVKVLLYEKSAGRTDYLMTELLYRLREAGHDASFAEKSMIGLGMDAGRIGRYVESIDADAWIVLAGPRGVLHWFSQQSVPAFALFGRLVDTSLAGVSVTKVEATRELVGRLVEMGHERIVLITGEDRRKPSPGFFELRYLECLEAHGIKSGAYNLPDWGDGPEELEKGLRALFRHTPPTAIITDEVSAYIAVMQQLARMGIVAPDQVSMACLDQSSSLDWCRPKITHLGWNAAPLLKRMVNWIEQVSRGKDDRRKSRIKAKLIAGGTIGPVLKR